MNNDQSRWQWELAPQLGPRRGGRDEPTPAKLHLLIHQPKMIIALQKELWKICVDYTWELGFPIIGAFKIILINPIEKKPDQSPLVFLKLPYPHLWHPSFPYYATRSSIATCQCVVDQCAKMAYTTWKWLCANLEIEAPISHHSLLTALFDNEQAIERAISCSSIETAKKSSQNIEKLHSDA